MKLKLVRIPAGSFMMGSNNGNNDEWPEHKAVIPKPFYMGATEVTRAQWKAVMGSDPSFLKFIKDDNLPVEQVLWEEAMEFCKKLTETEKAKGNLPEGYEYRLPLEAEWEYCCRAGSTTKYCFGDDENMLGEYAWFYGNSDLKTHPVGTKKPNAWGLYDMHGNVQEWCMDAFYQYTHYACNKEGRGEWYYAPKKGSIRHITRGGSAKDGAWVCRSASRAEHMPYIGFRVVCADALHDNRG